MGLQKVHPYPQRDYVIADNTAQTRIKNNGPATVYYGGPATSPASYEGSVTLGSTAILSQGKWFFTQTTTRSVLYVSDVAPAPTSGVGFTSGLAFKGLVADESGLPALGTNGDAYILDGDIYLWIEGTASWENIGPVAGLGGAAGPPGPAADLSSVQMLAGKNQPSGYAGLDASSKIANSQLPTGLAQSPVVVTWGISDGDVVAGAYPRPYIFPTNATGITVRAACSVGPDTQSILVDVSKNGSSIFTTQPNRPAVPAGLTKSQLATPDVTTASTGDVLTVDVPQVGIQPAEGTVAFVSATSQATASNVTTYNVTRSTSVQSGDVKLVMLISSVNNMSTPAGWTQIGTVVLITTNRYLYQYWRLDDGAPGPWTWTNATSQNMTTIFARKMAYRGVHQTTPVDVASNVVASSTSRALAALTTGNTNERLVVMLDSGSVGTAPTATLPSGYTARIGFDGVSALNVHVCDKLQAAAGASDTSAITTSNANAAILARVALRPAAAPAQWTPGEDLSVVLRYLEA